MTREKSVTQKLKLYKPVHDGCGIWGQLQKLSLYATIVS